MGRKRGEKASRWWGPRKTRVEGGRKGDGRGVDVGPGTTHAHRGRGEREADVLPFAPLPLSLSRTPDVCTYRTPTPHDARPCAVSSFSHRLPSHTRRPSLKGNTNVDEARVHRSTSAPPSSPRAVPENAREREVGEGKGEGMRRGTGRPRARERGKKSVTGEREDTPGSTCTFIALRVRHTHT